MSFKVHVGVLLLGMALLSCDEHLPTRQDPPSVLIPSLSLEPGPVLLVDSATVGRGGEISVEVINIYDEVLQDSALIKGTVEIWMETDTTKRATVTFNERALQNVSILFKGVLTVRVNERVFIATQWSQRTDAGEYFWRYVPTTEEVDSQGNPYLRSDTLFMAARASVQVFMKVQPLAVPEIHFPMVYIIR